MSYIVIGSKLKRWYGWMAVAGENKKGMKEGDTNGGGQYWWL